jgi:hypothetical protein
MYSVFVHVQYLSLMWSRLELYNFMEPEPQNDEAKEKIRLKG